MTATRSRSQSGIGHVILVFLLLAIMAAIALIGYKLYVVDDKTSSDTTSVTEGSTAYPEVAPSDVPDIKDTSDLDTADTLLDGIDDAGSNSSDINSLDSELNSF